MEKQSELEQLLREAEIYAKYIPGNIHTEEYLQRAKIYAIEKGLKVPENRVKKIMNTVYKTRAKESLWYIWNVPVSDAKRFLKEGRKYARKAGFLARFEFEARALLPTIILS